MTQKRESGEDSDVTANQGEVLNDTLRKLLTGAGSKDPVELEPGKAKNSFARSDCEDCNGTAWCGDNGPGIRGNVEYNVCECVDKRNVQTVTEDAMAYFMNHSFRMEQIVLSMSEWMKNARQLSDSLTAMLFQVAKCDQCHSCLSIVAESGGAHMVCRNELSERYMEKLTPGQMGCPMWVRRSLASDEPFVPLVMELRKKVERAKEMHAAQTSTEMTDEMDEHVGNVMSRGGNPDRLNRTSLQQTVKYGGRGGATR